MEEESLPPADRSIISALEEDWRRPGEGEASFNWGWGEGGPSPSRSRSRSVLVDYSQLMHDHTQRAAVLEQYRLLVQSRKKEEEQKQEQQHKQKEEEKQNMLPQHHTTNTIKGIANNNSNNNNSSIVNLVPNTVKENRVTLTPKSCNTTIESTVEVNSVASRRNKNSFTWARPRSAMTGTTASFAAKQRTKVNSAPNTPRKREQQQQQQQIQHYKQKQQNPKQQQQQQQKQQLQKQDNKSRSRTEIQISPNTSVLSSTITSMQPSNWPSRVSNYTQLSYRHEPTELSELPSKAPSSQESNRDPFGSLSHNANWIPGSGGVNEEEHGEKEEKKEERDTDVFIIPISFTNSTSVNNNNNNSMINKGLRVNPSQVSALTLCSVSSSEVFDTVSPKCVDATTHDIETEEDKKEEKIEKSTIIMISTSDPTISSSLNPSRKSSKIPLRKLVDQEDIEILPNDLTQNTQIMKEKMEETSFMTSVTANTIEVMSPLSNRHDIQQEIEEKEEIREGVVILSTSETEEDINQEINRKSKTNKKRYSNSSDTQVVLEQYEPITSEVFPNKIFFIDDQPTSQEVHSSNGSNSNNNRMTGAKCINIPRNIPTHAECLTKPTPDAPPPRPSSSSSSSTKRRTATHIPIPPLEYQNNNNNNNNNNGFECDDRAACISAVAAALQGILIQTRHVLPCYYCGETQPFSAYLLHLNFCRTRTEGLYARYNLNPLRLVLREPQQSIPTMFATEIEKETFAIACYQSVKMSIVPCPDCEELFRIHDLPEHHSVCDRHLQSKSQRSRHLGKY